MSESTPNISRTDTFLSGTRVSNWSSAGSVMLVMTGDHYPRRLHGRKPSDQTSLAFRKVL